MTNVDKELERIKTCIDTNNLEPLLELLVSKRENKYQALYYLEQIIEQGVTKRFRSHSCENEMRPWGDPR